jgi:hypothetical protein
VDQQSTFRHRNYHQNKPKHSINAVSVQCGKELNFVRSADRTPIIFFDLRVSQSGDSDEHDTLLFGGDIEAEFFPDKVTVDGASGRFYHPLILPKQHPIGSNHLGLLSSNIAVQLAPYLSHGEEGELTLTWRGRPYRVPIT